MCHILKVCEVQLTSEELCPQQRLSSSVCDGLHVCRDVLGIHILCTHKHNQVRELCE